MFQILFCLTRLSILWILFSYYPPKRKDMSTIFMILLCIVNIFWLQKEGIVSFGNHLFNVLLISLYFYFNHEKESILSYGFILSTIYLPYCLIPVIKNTLLPMITTPMIDAIEQYYSIYLLFPEFISYIFVYMIFMLYRHFMPASYQTLPYRSLLNASIMIVSMIPIYINSSYHPVFFTSSYFVGVISLVLLVVLFYTYHKEMEKNAFIEKNKVKLEMELEASQMHHTLYQREYHKMLELKHEVIRTLKEATPKDYLERIDGMLTPYITYFSSNERLNNLLTYQAEKMKTKKIDYDMNIQENLEFLSDEDLYNLFSRVFDTLYQNEVRVIYIKTTKNRNNHVIHYEYKADKTIRFNLLFDDLYHQLKKDYHFTYSQYQQEDVFHLSFNLIYTLK